MDRIYKRCDTVNVYPAAPRQGKPIAVLRQQPYSLRGFDNYIYEGNCYEGFEDLRTGEIYIFLTMPYVHTRVQ